MDAATNDFETWEVDFEDFWQTLIGYASPLLLPFMSILFTITRLLISPVVFLTWYIAPLKTIKHGVQSLVVKLFAYNIKPLFPVWELYLYLMCSEIEQH